jgi:subtilisin family serine protease
MIGVLFWSVPFAKAGASDKEQVALQIVSKRFNIPISELIATYQTNLADEKITLVKILHVPKIKEYVINLNSQDREVDDKTLQKVLATRRSRGFIGNKERALDKAARAGNATDLIRIAIWIRQKTNPPQIDRDASEHLREVQLEAVKKHHENLSKPVEQFILHNGGRITFSSRLAPIVYAEVPKSLITSTRAPALALLPEVETLYLERQYQPDQHKPVPYQPNLDISARAINADNFWDRGITGSSIKMAVVEDDGIHYAHPNLADGTYCNSTTPNVGHHATQVAGIIASTNLTYRGIAYGAPAVLSGNTLNYTEGAITQCTDWAINQGARIINYSFSYTDDSKGQTAADGYMYALDTYVDYIIRNHAVTMTKSAGNINGTCSISNPYVTNPGLGFNILSVGAFDDKDSATDSDPLWSGDEMADFSCWQNPISTYGDREKPELVAPGVSIWTTNASNGFSPVSGTSFAAPHVAGAAALLMASNSFLQYWPEEIRAILMASAIHNIDPDSDTTGINDGQQDDRDGTGALDLASALAVLDSNWSGHLILIASDPDTPITFNASQGQRVRFAIAWDSDPSGGPPWGTDLLKADYNLFIYNPSGQVVATSNTFDNSYEIVDFTANATGTYTAWIQ